MNVAAISLEIRASQTRRMLARVNVRMHECMNVASVNGMRPMNGMNAIREVDRVIGIN